jgi:hypothetical protein
MTCPEESRRTEDAVYDPVIPDIADSSICHEIFVRGYAEPVRARTKPRGDRPRQARPESWFDGEFLAIDTETVDHRLTFGAYERYRRQKCIERGVFCRDDLPTSDPPAFKELQAICKRLGVRLYLLANVFSSHIWRLRRTGGTFTFFNASYDLSRLASSWRPATLTARRGAKFENGFEFLRSFESYKDRDGAPLIGGDGELQSRTIERPYVRIRRDDRHHVRYDMGRANVLDLATLAHTLTDEVYTLEEACKAFGVLFEERPGDHDGTVTEANVAGCLYDVEKTGQLLFAAGAEYDRHPIDVAPWRAQSGASLAKGYLRAFGVAPRSAVQPDFPKEYQGIAAATYFGGRVEGRIVGELMPVAYIDALSMYPTIFDLLGLWFDQVIAARLEPEAIDPAEIQAILAELQANPRLLLDRAYWPRLAFFAQVDPNGAQLPCRPTIPSPYTSRRAMVDRIARRLMEEQVAAQGPYWQALDECGGKIVPDILFDRKTKRWHRAGEFIDVPSKLLRANNRRSATGYVDGNVDQIAQMIRDAMGYPDLTTSDVLDFFTSHERPTMHAAREAASAQLSDDVGDAASQRLVSIGPVTSHTPLWYAGPDLAAAAILGKSLPRVIKAWRLRPTGIQETLKPVAFRGDPNDTIDPSTTNPFKRLVELRKRETGNTRDDRLRKSGYKVIANSGAYGAFVETTPEDVDPKAPRAPSRVNVWGMDVFSATVQRPERHSPLCFFPIASLVTSGARLLLALAQRLVHDLGGEVAYCDTDSLFIVATENGGFAPCEGGQYRLADGRRAVRALSWAQVDHVLNELAALNVYDRTAVTGSSFKLEDENFDESKNRRDIFFFGPREKSYCLFEKGSENQLVPVKASAHTIGQYRSPYRNDRKRRWISEAWTYAVRSIIGGSVEEPSWLGLPAVSQLTLTTANLMEHCTSITSPFDFLAVAQLAFPGLLGCCNAPRPSCTIYRDPKRWDSQLWICLSCGTQIEPFMADTDQSIFKALRRVVAGLASAIEVKRLRADGAEPAPRAMRGLTIPRPVHVTSIEHIGKEVIVDPSEISEDLTAEQLNASDPVSYRNNENELDALRKSIRANSVSKTARDADVSRSIVKAFVNQGTTPTRTTLRKINRALHSTI